MPETPLVLIADEAEYVNTTLSMILENAGYKTACARDGQTCLKLLQEKRPTLVFLDLMLPGVLGVDILRSIRHSPPLERVGVVIMSGKALVQDYEEALLAGADYYLLKPFKAEEILQLTNRFFQGDLKPNSFPNLLAEEEEEPFLPTTKEIKNFLRFWGTRGSISVSGIQYFRFGGDTSCLEIRYDDEVVIIDAGTGIRELGNLLRSEAVKKIHLFISHTHWDHIIGFPFFCLAYNSHVEINIYAAKGYHRGISELFSGMLERDYFPIRFEEMRAKIHFHTLSVEQPVAIGDLKIHSCYVSHPGVTLGFKIETRDRMISYITDNEVLTGYHGHPDTIDADHPLLAPHHALIDFLKGCDLMIHEAQYTPQEYMHKVGWGHSSLINATILAKCAGITDWIVTHHDPEHTDTFLIEKLRLHRHIAKITGLTANIHLAYEGMTLPI